MKRTLHARAATEESWLAVLRDGDGEAAWDVFLDGHRRLMLATVRHYVRDYDDVMDVFARVCEGLRADRFARLRRYADKPPDSHTARFSTWLVAVLRNLIMDWFRVRDGRKQLSNAARALPPLQRCIYEHVFLNGRSHVEAYELLASRGGPSLTFSEFLRELTATYRAVSAGRRGFLTADLGGPVATSSDALPEQDSSPDPEADVSSGLLEALHTLPSDEQLAVQLFVIEELPAAEVARLVGWPNPKAVYNRVSRALARIRTALEEQGIRRQDL